MDEAGQLNIQRMFTDPDFEELVMRLEEMYFQAWKRSNDATDRERLHIKLELLEELLTTMRAVADSIHIDQSRKH